LDIGAVDALDPLKEVADKYVKKEVWAALANLGIRQRTNSFYALVEFVTGKKKGEKVL
jgi:hypothetical protein